MSGQKVYIEQHALMKLWEYCFAIDKEISGLGEAIVDEEGRIVVKDVFTFKQEVSGADTEISEDTVIDVLYDRCQKGKFSPLNVWWHTHDDMGVFWSGTDTSQISQFGDHFADWMVHIEVNKSLNYKVCVVSYNNPITMEIDDCSLIPKIVVPKDIKDEVDDKVSVKTYPIRRGRYWENGVWQDRFELDVKDDTEVIKKEKKGEEKELEVIDK